MAIAIDGSVNTTATTGTAIALPGLTTTSKNDILVIFIAVNGANVASVTDTAGLVWTQRSVAGDAVAQQQIWEFYAKSVAILTSDVITVNFDAGIVYMAAVATAVSGAYFNAPYDSGAGVIGNGVPLTITTTSQNSLVFGAFREAFNPTPTPGLGFTALYAVNYMLVEYAILSAATTGFAVLDDSTNNGAIAEAIATPVVAWHTPAVSFFR